MTADRLKAIGAAAGDEAATGSEQRRDPTAVEADQSEQQQGQPARCPTTLAGGSQRITGWEQGLQPRARGQTKGFRANR